MNIDRLDHCIKTMERVRDDGLYFDMAAYFRCGTPSCFLGHLAVTDEWRDAGGDVDDGYFPRIATRYGADALYDFLECDDRDDGW